MGTTCVREEREASARDEEVIKKDATIPGKIGESGRSHPECPAYPRRVKVAAIQKVKSEATRNPAGNCEVSARPDYPV